MDGNAVKVQIKGLTRAQIEAAAADGTLADREPYLITDEGRIAVGTGTGTFSAMATQEEMETFANVAIRTPSNALPLNMATDVSHDNLTLMGSTYTSLRGNAMAALHVQVSMAPDFVVKLIDSGDIAGTSTSYVVSAGVLPGLTTIYWRMRYKDATGEYSAWSVATSFTTATPQYIPTPEPTPASFGDPFEGGFYAGMIWNELAQSATSTTIGTGEKTFVVPTMSGTPLVYVGQSLEVRSRANPSNNMAGTVTGAAGTTLTLNVTSVGGSGTFADWSIMSRYRVIVAPKASGENAGTTIKNAKSALPAACQTLTEGLRATQSMRDADTSTVYPAAHWARGLNIGGKTDWYIPARDELELCWRNLKPTTAVNYVTADRDVSPSFVYKDNGSLGSTGVLHGRNDNSAPAGAAYTAGMPAQTTATTFKTGGAEAFEFGAGYYYWSSSDYSITSAWIQYCNTVYPGYQGGVYGTKTTVYRVRAVRRSII